MSLRIKLLFFSIVLALIPLGIAGENLIRITRDELKDAANHSLMGVASQISRDIEDFFKYSCVAQLNLIQKAIESKELGFNEKISLLTEGIRNVPDFVSIQVSVEGIPAPLMVVNQNFFDHLKSSGNEPSSVLELPYDQIIDFLGDQDRYIGDIRYLPPADRWLSLIILRLNPNSFLGRPAFLIARIDLRRIEQQTHQRATHNGVFTLLIDAQGHRLFDPDKLDISHFEIVKSAMQVLSSSNRTAKVEPYTRPTGEKMLGAYAFPDILEIGIIVEKNEKDAYLAVQRMIQNLVTYIIVGFSVAVFAAIIVSISLTRPLRRLTMAARKISKGDLSIRVECSKSTDEIGELSLTFNKMVEDLHHYIDQLTETTKAKERAESELKLAKTIQESFLPKSFPELDGIDVWGKCDPAREVGGDYFDFFQIDEVHYGLVVGDVSGKGVAAALFMAVSRTLFRILSARRVFPDQVLLEFNDRLVELDQGANMFITLFYGILNIRSGRLQYSTAGHHMPYIGSINKGPPQFRVLPGMKTMVAGIMDGIPLEAAEIKLEPGDTIVLYTDGMTEAINENDEEFGENRLAERLNTYVHLPAKNFCETLIAEVQQFQQGKPQFDDMTLFALKFHP